MCNPYWSQYTSAELDDIRGIDNTSIVTMELDKSDYMNDDDIEIQQDDSLSFDSLGMSCRDFM